VPAARHPDRVELVEEEDAAARLAGGRELPGEATRLAEQRDDDQGIDAHPHARQARRVDIDEGQVRFRRHDAREERLAGAGRAREEHALGHVATAVLERLYSLEDPNEALRVLEQVGLTAVVLKGEPDLRVVRRDRVGARTGHEPHQRSELHDHHERVEEQ
jgi:hypothetical protein